MYRWLFPCFLLASAGSASATEGLPLEPTRTISFTTTEGTWMSVDVSPDGRRIVVDLLGDLYSLPLAGGRATRLTEGLAWDESPRFSPDGRRIAFVSDRSGSAHLWVMSADGSDARRVTRENVDWMSSPVWTPDGLGLVARRKHQDGSIVTLWQYDVAEGSGTELVARKSSVSGGALSPDGKTVYFCEEAENNRFVLLALDKETRRVTTLATPGKGGFRPLVSPNGQWLVYVAEESEETVLRIRDRTTEQEQVLAAPVLNDGDIDMFDGKEAFPGYAFTPDSRAVIVAADGKLQRIDVATRRVTTIPFEVQVRAELGPLVRHRIPLDDGPLQVRQMRSVNASPDGTRLTFAAVGKTWIMDVGKAPRRLTSSPLLESDPVFSPDGRWIAFVTWSDEKGGALWKVPAKGGAPVRLTTDVKVYAAPRWTPDGSRILFLAAPAHGWAAAVGEVGKGPAPQIARIRADGGPMEVVIQKTTQWGHMRLMFAQFDDHLTVSGDGTRVFFLEAEDDFAVGHKFVLRSVALAGRDVRSHARIDGRAVRAVPSPDGEWLALQDRFNVHLVPFATLREGVPGDQGDGLPVIVPAGKSALPVTPLTTEGGVAPYWSADGTRLMFSRSHELYEVALADVVAHQGRIEPRKLTIELRVPRPTPAGKLLLRGARLVTMASSGVRRSKDASGAPEVSTDPMVIEQGDVLIDGRRILAVGPSGSFNVPADVTVLEMAGKTIIPGLIGTHEDPISVGMENQHRVTQSWGFAERLAYGVTTAQAPVMGYVTAESVERIEAGDMVGPRIFNTVDLIEPGHQDIRSQQEAEHVARKYKALGFHLLKLRGIPQRTQQQWLARAAARVGMNATVHGKYSGWGQMLSVILDGFTGWEHDLLQVSPPYRDVVELVGRAGTFGSNQIVRGFLAWESDVEAAKMERFYPPGWWRKREFPATVSLQSLMKEARAAVDDRSQSAHAARAFVRAGSTITVGSHSGARAVHAVMWNAVMLGGMTSAEALCVGTLNGARAIGIADDLGSLEPGKVADLVILNRNPLDNIRYTANIQYVVKDGVVYRGETLETVWPVAKPFPKFQWLN